MKLFRRIKKLRTKLLIIFTFQVFLLLGIALLVSFFLARSSSRKNLQMLNQQLKTLADSDFQDILSAEQDESVMTTHLLSQLSYLADPQQKTFLSFFGETSDTFANAYDYVKEHGISIYGCVFYGEKEQLLRLSEVENVYGIYAQR